MIKRAYIKHIVSAYPENIEYNDSEGRLTHKIGVYKRPTALPNECASDLAVKAAEELFSKYNINRSTIGAVVFVTQTPDYIMPATGCVVHGRLGLSNDCMAFDVNQGCAGYITGLSIAKGLIESSQVENVLLITADTLSKIIHPQDMRVKPIFGDSAAVTLLSGHYSRSEFMRDFRFGTNGADFRKIIIHYGAMRMKYADRDVALQEISDNYGNIRTDGHLYMDGKSVLNFTSTVVPPMMADILKSARLNIDDIDNFIFHQANKFMLEKVQSVCGIPDDERYFNNVEEIGNTSSASIPNAINRMQERNIVLGKRCLLMGFGVGLSWGGCLVDLTTLDEEEY